MVGVVKSEAQAKVEPQKTHKAVKSRKPFDMKGREPSIIVKQLIATDYLMVVA